MIIEKQTLISKDLANKKLMVEREFDAPLHDVWRAWTESDLLDLWWAPKPWKAETKSMDFREGGRWLYAMVGPDGTRMFSCVDFQNIDPNQGFIAEDGFCDEQGNLNEALPKMNWKTLFTETDTGTKVEVEIAFSSVADLEKIIQMGFKEGFTAALSNLDELLQNQF
jgi:uncharacterized protein YndB with AHSA1/START domain